ncbi:MAG: class GN sortase [Kangiellaceae bacterium]|nr:class GN sortase [Kangiellaceae bacterium]
MKKIVRILIIIGFTLSALGLLRIGYFEAKAELAQHLMQTAWEKSQSLLGDFNSQLSQKIESVKGNIKPWPWADTWPVFKMTIPKIGSNSLVLKDASGESLAFGPGLLTTNINPGDKGNSFIAAHRDTHFERLRELTKGDIILIEDLTARTIRFEVDQIEIVDSRTSQPITDIGDTRLTLVTCYPFDATEANTPYRYLVSGRKVISEIKLKTKNLQSAETKLASLR